MTKVYPSFVAPSIAREVFGVTSQTLRRWAKEGKISFILTPGGQYRYNVEGHIGALQARPVAAKAPKHPAKPAVVEVRAPQPMPVAPVVAPVAAPAAPVPPKPTGPAPAARPVQPTPVHADPVHVEPPKPRLDPAALRHKIEALASASAV